MKTQIAFGSLLAFLAVVAPLSALAAVSTQDFEKNAAIGNQFEISSSELALQDYHSDVVRQFAQQMIDDHKQIGDQMVAALTSSPEPLPPPPTTLDSKHQKMLDALNKAPAADFDKKYIDDQVKGHKEAVKLFKDYNKNGDNESLKNFAAGALPVIEGHLDHIKQIKAAY